MNRIPIAAIVMAIAALSCRTAPERDGSPRQSMRAPTVARPFPTDLPPKRSADCFPPGIAWRSPQQSEARVWLRGKPGNLHPTIPIGAKAKVIYQAPGPEVSSDEFWLEHESSLPAPRLPAHRLRTRRSVELELQDFVDVRQPGLHYLSIKPKSAAGKLRLSGLAIGIVPETIHHALEALNELPRHSVDLFERSRCYPGETAPEKTVRRIVELKQSMAALGTEVIWQPRAGHYQIARSQFFLDRERVHKAEQQCSYAKEFTLLKVPATPHCGCPGPELHIGVTKRARPSILKRPVNKPDPDELNCPAEGLVCKPPKAPRVSTDCVRGWCIAVYE